MIKGRKVASLSGIAAAGKPEHNLVNNRERIGLFFFFFFSKTLRR